MREGLMVAPGRIAIIWIAATLLMFPAFANGHIVSDNSFSNVNWSQGFAQGLLSEDFYPRWLPAMNAGAGSPVFYFYGPLPFYLTAPFELITGPRFAVLLGIWLMLALSGHSFFALAGHFVRVGPALVASLAYMATPYHLLVDVWLRSDLGELAAYIFIPLCLFGAFKLATEPIWTFGLAFSFAGLLLSHLPTALLFAPFLAIAYIYVAWRSNVAVVSVRTATALCLGVGLAATYILPALLLQGMIHASNWDIYRPSDNLLFNGRTGGFDYFLDFSAASTVIIGSIFVAGLIAASRWRQIEIWAIFAIVAVLLMSPVASYLWNGLPAVFDKIQFPWRALSILELSVCMLFAITLDSKMWENAVVVRLMLYGLIAVTTLFAVYRSRDPAHGFVHRPPTFEDYLISARVEPLEYLPSCLTLRKSEKLIRISDSIVERSMHEKPLNELSIFYYPFLTARVDGKVVSTSCDSKTGFMVVAPHNSPIDIEKRATPEERTGNAMTLASFLIVALGAILSSRTKVWREILFSIGAARNRYKSVRYRR